MKHIITLLLLTISIISYSQKKTTEITKEKLSEIDKKEIIDSITKKLEEFYIRPNSIDKIKTKLNEKYKIGQYKNISNANEYASALTTDIIDISKDLHFSVMYDEQWVNDKLKSKDVNINIV